MRHKLHYCSVKPNGPVVRMAYSAFLCLGESVAKIHLSLFIVSIVSIVFTVAAEERFTVWRTAV